MLSPGMLSDGAQWCPMQARRISSRTSSACRWRCCRHLRSRATHTGMRPTREPRGTRCPCQWMWCRCRSRRRHCSQETCLCVRRRHRCCSRRRRCSQKTRLCVRRHRRCRCSGSSNMPQLRSRRRSRRRRQGVLQGSSSSSPLPLEVPLSSSHRRRSHGGHSCDRSRRLGLLLECSCSRHQGA